MKTLLILAAALSLASCQRLLSHNARHTPYSSSEFFENGASAQTPPEFTVPRGQPIVGVEAPPRERLLRGQELYQIFCVACHSSVGDGDGLVVRRGFPRPETFHQDRLREAPDSYFETVIRDGLGRMYPMADRIDAADRKLIVAYVRALQLSQHAKIADLPADLRQKYGEKAAGQ